MSTKIPGMVHQGLLAPQGLNIFGQMDRISPNFVNAFIFTSSRLGLLPSIFCLFITELWPLIDVRILFLLYIFRTWPFNSMKSAETGLSSKISDNSSFNLMRL